MPRRAAWIFVCNALASHSYGSCAGIWPLWLSPALPPSTAFCHLFPLCLGSLSSWPPNRECELLCRSKVASWPLGVAWPLSDNEVVFGLEGCLQATGFYQFRTGFSDKAPGRAIFSLCRDVSDRVLSFCLALLLGC